MWLSQMQITLDDGFSNNESNISCASFSEFLFCRSLFPIAKYNTFKRVDKYKDEMVQT